MKQFRIPVVRDRGHVDLGFSLPDDHHVAVNGRIAPGSIHFPDAGEVRFPLRPELWGLQAKAHNECANEDSLHFNLFVSE
jgi:hypothetical protein